MNTAVRRNLTVILVLAAVLTVAAALVPAWRSPTTAAAGWVDTEWGPLGPSDRDMLYKVRQAGLWEMPVGQEMAQRAVDPDVRGVGEKISAEHHELDDKVRETALQLQVTLPDSPNSDQQSWMAQISASSSGDYDRTAVQLLRAAHGKVLPVLAAVRVGTRNTLVRRFAEDATVFVTRHVGYLEGTGLVDFAALPEPPAPTPAGQPVQASWWDTHDPRSVAAAGVVIVLVAAAAAAIAASLLRGRRSQRPAETDPTDLSIRQASRHRRRS